MRLMRFALFSVRAADFLTLSSVARRSSRIASITIADNGPGMPPDVLRRAFEPEGERRLRQMLADSLRGGAALALGDALG